MPWLIERWLSGPVWIRIVSLVVITILLTLAAWFFVIHPQHSLTQQLVTGNQQANQKQTELRRKIWEIKSLEKSLLSISAPIFSVSQLVGQSNGQLLKWQPEEKQGVLEMLIPWEMLPIFFTRLAEYRVVSSHSFTITTQGEWLKLVLTMEFADEP
ncbi:hypothetical protein FH968_10250 [Buttiauxella sp. B2]|uniref:HofO family protein n=1 Tax=Buttiauxella sp. B2 TaxID=2587812 RepID=UPI001121BD2B|nr:hypothetical protein [Buttiauxella sp. B2]TNV20376.1 hypothetical protein FH968_10250 [Buttiauxella sp. B2]